MATLSVWDKDGIFSILSAPWLKPAGSNELSVGMDGGGFSSWRDLLKLELRCVDIAEMDRLLLLLTKDEVGESGDAPLSRPPASSKLSLDLSRCRIASANALFERLCL
jgi:hypothetical protein